MSENIINGLETEQKEQKEQKIELSKKLLRIVGQTNAKYSLFEEGDYLFLYYFFSLFYLIFCKSFILFVYLFGGLACPAKNYPR